jgi:hypothetical protein
VQSYNGTGTNYRTDSGFNNPSYYTIQDMKTLIGIAVLGTGLYFLLPYIIVASILMFDGFLFGYLIESAIGTSPQQ